MSKLTESVPNSERPLPKANVSQSFRDRADGAAFWEAWTAAVLTRCGLFVTMYPWAIDGADHSKTFDLHVSNGPTDNPDGIDGTAEVKSLNLAFKGPASYPFETVLVCTQSNFLKKWPKTNLLGRDFLMVSRQTGHLVWVPKGTPVAFNHQVTDHSRGETFMNVTVPRSSLRALSAYVSQFNVPQG